MHVTMFLNTNEIITAAACAVAAAADAVAATAAPGNHIVKQVQCRKTNEIY